MLHEFLKKRESWCDARDCAGKLRRFDFDERALNLSLNGPAKKIALLRRSIVIRAADRAATVSGQRRTSRRALGEAVEMPVENGDEIKFLEPRQCVVRVERAHRHENSEREMREDDGWLRGIQLWQLIIKPGQSRGLNPRVLRVSSLSRVERDNLPVAMLEMIIPAAREKLLPRRMIGVRDGIVIAGNRVNIHPQ